MADSKKHDFLTVVPIKNNVCALSELDHPFTELGRQFVNRATNLGVVAENLHSLPDSFDRAPCCFAALCGEKIVKAKNVALGMLGPLQTWHSGASASSPASSLANQESASTAVK